MQEKRETSFIFKINEYAQENILVLLSVNTRTGSGKLNLGSSTSALERGIRVRGKEFWT